MKLAYLKDFVIVLVVLILLSFGIKDYYLYHIEKKVPQESVYKEIALSDVLLKQINSIEASINDRKNFVFTVEKDPLEQNLIVKTQQDLEKQWVEEVQNMVRLESTIIPQKGPRMASIAYKGKSFLYKIGDTFIKGKISDIKEGAIDYSYQGLQKTLTLQKIPPRPAEISRKSKHNKTREYNW